ncbi:MAG TPA: hypothetical protein VGM92_03190 [Candidatus Kapabacteria bacterium]
MSIFPPDILSLLGDETRLVPDERLLPEDRLLPKERLLSDDRLSLDEDDESDLPLFEMRSSFMESLGLVVNPLFLLDIIFS